MKHDHLVKAACLLLELDGRYFYGESFNEFIEITDREYRMILGNPHLYYFSTALKKHCEWRNAVRKRATMAFSDVVGA